MKKNIVFGGQGFIGQNLCSQLIKNGESVVSIDKNIWGLKFSDFCIESNNFSYYNQDINSLDYSMLPIIENNAKEDIFIWHLAANSDIFKGVSNIDIDLNDTLMTTINIMKFMEKYELKNIIFASSSAVYGKMLNKATENTPTRPISNYGGMKLASEAVLSAFQLKHDGNCIISRFPNVVGTPATHGVIIDLIKKLQKNKTTLDVLGNGQQNKNYLHVNDLISSLLHLRDLPKNNIFDVYNIGGEGPNVYVKDIAERVRDALNPNALIKYQDSEEGWVGDVPKIELSMEKLNSTGWRNSMSGLQAVQKTITDILDSNR
jgi:UDP-glucose 4-epimerase